MPRRVLLSWSSGKDSAWTLHLLREDPDTEVVGLLTTVNTTHERVAMHSTRRSILEAQAQASGLPLYVLPLPWPCPNDVYEQEMRMALIAARQRGVTHMAFGDLFLEDIRAYRIMQLYGSGIEPVFPIWHTPTELLARRMINASVKAVITCVDAKKLPRTFAGREFDNAFLDDLPEEIDPCGENGEFHTCVIAGPMLREPLQVTMGEVIEREGFYFADLIPADAGCGLGANLVGCGCTS
jgi:uncharacterized protein (TIGR00290 family)